MAKKQQKPAPPPIDEPPSASSDKDPSLSHEEAEEASSEDSEASSEDTPPPSKTSQPPKPASSDSATGSDDSGSESDSPVPSNPKPKPLASKPMLAHTPTSIPKPPQPSAKDKPALKRPAKSNGPASDPKRAKKNGKASASSASASAAASDDDNDEEAEEEGAKKAGGDTRKLFQRLWSEDDEIAILKGMVEFIPNTGLDPYKHADSFYDFVKKSLHTEASSNQLKEKIRRLKKKFENNAQRGKNGEDPNFTKPFDREAFELSKKVWGNANGGVGKEVKAAKSERNVAKTPKKEGRSTSVATPTKGKLVKSEARSVDSRKDVKMDADEETDTTYAASYIMGVIRGDKGVGLLNEDMLKRGMDLIGESERKEFEGQWKELRDAEIELSIKRAELAANHAKLALEAYKSSSH